MAADAKLTVNLDSAVIEEARDAVAWLQRHGDPALGDITLRRLVEEGLRSQLEQYRRHHYLLDFPARADQLRRGRPVGP